jgi:hypothetical protein
VSFLVGVYGIVQSTFRNLELNFQYWPESFTGIIMCLTVPLICRNYLMSCKENEQLCNNSLVSFVNTRFFSHVWIYFLDTVCNGCFSTIYGLWYQHQATNNNTLKWRDICGSSNVIIFSNHPLTMMCAFLNIWLWTNITHR